MPNKPDMFGIKFWLAVDAETKYLFNSFPCPKIRDTFVSLPKYVVTKLMHSIFKRGYNVTCDFFTYLDVSLHLADQKCGMIGRVRHNRRKLPKTSKKSSSSSAKLPYLHLLKQLLLLSLHISAKNKSR